MIGHSCQQSSAAKASWVDVMYTMNNHTYNGCESVTARLQSTVSKLFRS